MIKAPGLSKGCREYGVTEALLSAVVDDVEDEVEAMIDNQRRKFVECEVECRSEKKLGQRSF